MYKPQEGIGERGEKVPGPPWILGHRGSPKEAPENTLVSLRRALEVGLDGVEYDVHACASGEAVLIHDETLDRTTDAHGAIAHRPLSELFGLDAGGWFDKRFAGEPLPLLEEALELSGDHERPFPQHMIELKDPGLVAEVARQLAERHEPLTVRVASFHRRVCIEARDLGLPSMLLAVEASEEDRVFVRDERIAAYGTGPAGWDVPAGEAEWSCERWSWSVDEPDDLLAACRAPLFGFNTNQPQRALAVRALVHLTPQDDGPYPLAVPRLEVRFDPMSQLDPSKPHGAWSGHWKDEVRVRNPFPYPVDVTLALAVRGGAFRVEGFPQGLRLQPGEQAGVPFELAGGSYSPGDDPLVFARFVWRRGPGRPEESLILDAPLERMRSVTLRRETQRLSMLREREEDPSATMTVRLRDGYVMARVEDAGGLMDVQATMALGAVSRVGGPAVRIPLSPLDLRRLPGGRAFSVGFRGKDPADPEGPPRLRRFAGGLAEGVHAGAPGRAYLDADA